MAIGVSELELMNRIAELCRQGPELRFLGRAQLKTEGGIVAFDDAPPSLSSSMRWAIADIFRKKNRRKKINQRDVDKADAVVRETRAKFRKDAEEWCERNRRPA